MNYRKQRGPSGCGLIITIAAGVVLGLAVVLAGLQAIAVIATQQHFEQIRTKTK